MRAAFSSQGNAFCAGGGLETYLPGLLSRAAVGSVTGCAPGGGFAKANFGTVCGDVVGGVPARTGDKAADDEAHTVRVAAEVGSGVDGLPCRGLPAGCVAATVLGVA